MNGGLGDVLMCTPGLRALKRDEPECRIKFYSHYAEVVAELPYIDEAYPLDAAPPKTLFVGYGAIPPYSHIAQIIGSSLGVRVLDVILDRIV
jgi:hypothetical protein